ncbi:uncharacterized protein N7498_009067 [Penicillium cinerascens]|uniref:Uncharacterized protein n=1 Tax=Penicillium cinerascens TaxID=70096 RepID=A0A9W9JEP8_9EURO|nr:uncharacterized protein N7498_009067 [Penicillium cinerascens]KAJ5195629.1 hypothetical protein N7498_009067 [Penicillium cinerascens]
MFVGYAILAHGVPTAWWKDVTTAEAKEEIQTKCRECAPLADVQYVAWAKGDQHAKAKAKSTLVVSFVNPRDAKEVLSTKLTIRNHPSKTELYLPRGPIPAHLGVPGNELADEHAKRAIGWRSDKQHVSPPDERFSDRVLRSAAERMIKKSLKGKWAHSWKIGKHGSHLRRWLPVVEPARTAMKRYSDLSAAQSAGLFQARTSKIGLNHFLASIDRADTE